MQKLVSKNPIQRFKQGRQIQKFQKGKELYTTGVKSGSGVSIQKNWKDTGRYTDFMKNQSDIYDALVEANGGNHFGNTYAMQKFLNSKLSEFSKKNNAEYGSISEDNKFGNQTEEASRLVYELLKNPSQTNPYVESATTVVNPQTSPTKPLYRTDFNYTGSNRAIRDLGFNNYSGLQNFVRSNTDHQFAKDLTQRFGNVDNWKQEDVENALGVRGTYRRGINGDYSDIMRSMASWAGTQNGNDDKALQTASSKLNWNYNPNFQQQIAEIDKLPFIRRQKYLKQGGLTPKSPIKQFKFLREGGHHINFMTEVIHPL